MNTSNLSALLVAKLSKFFHEIMSALFVQSDKKEFQRLKDFIAS
ncbi:MAG: hypothetical protein ABIS01_15195 [Ferruginibacter sp.]